VIGIGENIDIWNDPWIPSLPRFKPSNPPHLKVADLINPLIEAAKLAGTWIN
jgi:hypothetical protein